MHEICYLIELNDMWMTDEFKDVNFSGYAFNIANILDLLFFKDFDCDLDFMN